MLQELDRVYSFGDLIEEGRTVRIPISVGNTTYELERRGSVLFINSRPVARGRREQRLRKAFDTYIRLEDEENPDRFGEALLALADELEPYL